MNHDAHNGTLAQADVWLNKYIAPLLSNSAFQQDGTLIIVWWAHFTRRRGHFYALRMFF